MSIETPQLVVSDSVIWLSVSAGCAPGSSRLRVGVGQTRMTMRLQGAEIAISSRYAHVYVDDGGWRLLSAQGTPEDNQG